MQPVQVVAVGGPVAAIPLGDGYHHKGKGYHSPPVPISYGHPPPTYHHPPAPAYHPPPAASYGPPQVPSSGYGAPQASYGAPAPTYHAPQSSYSVPAPAKASYGHHKGPTVVKHVHSHQHHYNGGLGGYAKDNRFSGSQVSTSFDSFENFNSFSSINKVGSALPIVPPRQREIYAEDCECVSDSRYCAFTDIVPRSNSNFLNIDARSKKTTILANEDHVAAESENHEVVETAEGTEENTARHKRDTMVFKDRTRDNRDTMVFRTSSRPVASLSPAASTSRLGPSSSINSLGVSLVNSTTQSFLK